MAVYIHFPQSFHGVDTCRKSIFISAIWAQLVGDPQGHVAVGRWVDDPPGHTSANGGRPGAPLLKEKMERWVVVRDAKSPLCGASQRVPLASSRDR